MATYGSSIYQYQRPSEVDVSVLGKAVQYKQQQYDANTSNIQNLVSQYVNMSLLRPEDSEYFGERVNTLVNYVNSSGQKDWSRNTVYRDVSNYIGNAIDSNVVAAIASTKAYQAQMAEIEEIRKNKPELYNQANVWKATEDLNRYMESGKLGDKYRPGTYNPYVDVNKRVMEMAPKLLKDFGMQIKYSSQGGNMYFERVGKHEIVTQEEAQRVVGLILGDDGRNQLAINAGFKNQMATSEEVKNNFVNHINNQTTQFKRQIETMKSSKAGATEAEKQVLDNNIQILNDQISQLEIQAKTTDNRDAMLFKMEHDNFVGNWGGFFAYDKLVDVETLDHNFKIAEFQLKEQQYNIENQLSYAKLGLSERELELNEAKALGEGSVIRDPNTGKLVANPNFRYDANTDGINTIPTPGAEDNTPELTIEQVNDQYTADYQAVVDAIKAEMDAKGEEFTDVYGTNAQSFAWALIGQGGVDKANSRAAKALSQGLISQETYDLVVKAKGSYAPWVKSQKMISDVTESLRTNAQDLVDNMKGHVMYGMSDHYLDKDGNLRDGEYYLANNSKKFSEMSKAEQAGATLNAILLRERNGGLSTNEKQALNAMKRNLIATYVPKDQQEEAISRYTYHGFWNGAGLGGSEVQYIYQAIRGKIGQWSGDLEMEEDARNKGSKLARDHTYKVRDLRAWRKDVGNTNYDTEDWGTNRIMNEAIKNNDPTRYESEIKGKGYQRATERIIGDKLKQFDEELQKFNTLVLGNNSITIDTSLKQHQDIKSFASAYVPGMELAKDATVQFDINTQNGTATMNVPVMDGKEIAITPVEVRLADLPQKILANTNLSTPDMTYHAQGQAQSYTWEPEIPKTDKALHDQFGNQYVNLASEGFKSQEGIMKSLNQTFGTELVKENEQYIKEVLSEPIKSKAFTVGGVYVMDTTVGDFVNRRNLETQDLGVNLNYLSKYETKIASEVVENHLRQVLIGKQAEKR